MRYFREYRAFWWGVFVLSIVGIVLIALTAIVADEANQSNSATLLREYLKATPYYPLAREIGAFATNDAVSAVSIGGLSSLMAISIIYIFKIPEIRRISIQILAAGYYENFLHSVIQKVHSQAGSAKNSVLIVLPGFALVENRKIYWNAFQSLAEKNGFRFVQETTDADFGRNIFTIQRRDDKPVPVFIDMPTTLTNLKKIIELEEHSPVGTTSTRSRIKHRFYVLREQFRKELETYVKEHDWGNVRFIEGRSVTQFEKQLGEILDSLDGPGAAAPV